MWGHFTGMPNHESLLPHIATHSRGAGIGMEIAASKGQEQLLLDLAYSYMNAADSRTVPEGAPDTYAASNQGDMKELIAWQLRTEEPEPVPEETTEPVETPPVVPEEGPQAVLPTWWPFALLIALGALLMCVAIIVLVKTRKQKEPIPME